MELSLAKRFGLAVRKHRRQLNWTQQELAELSGLHRTYISDIEWGKRNASLQIVDSLARALRVPVAALFPESVAPEDQ